MRILPWHTDRDRQSRRFPMPDRRPARLTAGRLTVALAAAVLLALALSASTFVISYEDFFRAEYPLVRNDVARLAPARAERAATIPAVEVVDSVRLLLANGTVVQVSRDENPALFSLVIGGYGLYGVILDVTLRVTRDELYEQRAVSMDYREFPGYFARNIKPDSDVVLMLARPSIDPNPASFLREVVVVTWRRAGPGGPGGRGSFDLTEEAHVWRDRLFFGLSRRFDWAKSLRWRLQKKVELGAGEARIVSRNNAMRPPLAPLEFLEYHSRRDTDIIQEYYVPIE